MKIYIITPEPFPHGMAATNRIICYAKSLLFVGIDVEVVNFHRTEIKGRQIKNTEGSGMYEGIDFRYINGITTRHKTPFICKYHDWRDKKSTISYLNNKLSKDDIVFLYFGREVEYSLELIKLAKKKKAYIVRDLCELPYGTGAETEQTVRKRKISLEQQFPKLDGFICISDTLLALAKEYGSKNAQYIKIPILVDYKKFYMEDLSAKSEIPYIFHCGTLYEQKDGILGMIEAFGKAVSRINSPVKFVLTGKLEKSPHKREIDQLIQKYNLNNKIIFTGYLSYDELRDRLSKASLVIINKYETQQNHFCFSTKLGEYLAAAKPVIITQVGEAMNYLENGKNAIVVPPGNNEALADAILHAFNDTEYLKKIGKAGQLVCQNNFDYRVQGEVLKGFMTSLKSR